MKSEFLLAITQLAAEKKLPKEVILTAVESALVSAYRKDNFAPDQKITAKIDPSTGKVEVRAEKTVVEKVTDSRAELSVEEARKIKRDAKVGDVVEIEATPKNAGRIAAQTAKQVILQRLHEAEHNAILEEYAGKEGDIISGMVQRTEPAQVLLTLDRTEAVLPASEQMRTERYRAGQRLKVYLLEVSRTTRGPRLIVSRSHPNLVRRLFEQEIPEVQSGVVEIKSIARDAGFRTKIAVAARQEGVDPVGCCVGLRGIRIQNIVNELASEKIDVVQWHSGPAVFIASALSPAQVLSIELSDKEGIATVIVPDRQLSLAIGKEGQNARLAAKLTGWRIDIKSASMAETERAAREAERAAKKAEEAARETELPVEPEAAEVVEKAKEIPEPVAAEATIAAVPFEAAREAKRELRFAEDILAPAPAKPVKEKKKKRSPERERGEEDKPKRGRRIDIGDIIVEDEEY